MFSINGVALAPPEKTIALGTRGCLVSPQVRNGSCLEIAISHWRTKLLALTLSIAWLLAAESSGAAGGMTYEEYLEQNGIDPAEPAFVRLVSADLPADCEKSVVEAFVEKRKVSWSSLQKAELDQDRASPDGYARVELVIQEGKPTKSILAQDSTDSIALMERLQSDFSTLVFAKQCSGTARIELRFHLPSSNA